MVCKGTCTKYKVNKPYNMSRYHVGQKRCSTCDIFMFWDGKHCPCCNFVLRTKPKGGRTRQKLMILNKVRRI